MNMKNLLFALFLSITSVFYAQENNPNEANADQIKLMSTEVGPSGLLQFTFDSSKTVIYKVYSQNNQVLSKELQVNPGLDARKIDLSTLSSGVYMMKFYVDLAEVKQIQFTKL
jgi:uncharacterized protein YpmB